MCVEGVEAHGWRAWEVCREAATAVKFQVLGSLEVRRGETTVALGSRRQRTLLARLLVDAGAVVSLDALAVALWADQSPADPRNAIQTYVARLRELLGADAPLVTRSPGYVLEVEPDQVDASRFERLLSEAQRRRERPVDARRLLDEGLGLWRGPAYAEFADGVARAEALRLEEQRLTAVGALAAARLALGEAPELVGELEAEVAEHPLRERFVELHMEALAAADRQAEALAVYRAYRHRLADETGLEPSPSIRALEDRILRGELAGSARKARERTDEDVPPPAVTASRPPMAPTSLVGREQEIADIGVALDRHRVVTLTGTGGVGKTRLAAEVGAAVDREEHGEVAWIELASVADPTAVEHVVATALGIDLGGGQPPRRTLLDALAGRRLLLVVDNAEHLLGTVAPLVDDVRRGCPHVRVLATSRERLAVEGERVMAVAPLDTRARDGDVATTEAVRLFLDRAADVAGDHDLSDHLQAVVEICRQLDGLPLAIELAAARTAALTPQDLLAALREDVPAAVGNRRSRPDRHRDLWAVVDWSYRLLADDERLLFERLGVFAGAFGVDETHDVCAPEGWPWARTVDRLAALVERSLVSGPAGAPIRGSGRYRLLRPLRAFARQRLADRGELAPLADRHAAVLTERAERAAGPPLTEEGRRWLEASLDDLRAASRRARLTGDVALLGRLVAAAYRFDYWRPGSELLSWADDALDLDGVEAEPTAPQVHAAAAAAAWLRGDLARARRLAKRGTELGRGRDDVGRRIAFEALGDVSNFAGRLDDAEAAFREEVRLARLHGDADSEAMGLASAGLVLAYAGRVTEAVEAAEAAARVAGHAGQATHAFVRYAQGECLADTDPRRAVVLVEEAARLARACDAWFVEGVARVTAASLWARHGEAVSALPAFAELIRHWHRSGSWTPQWTTLRNLAELLVRLEVDEPAVVIAVAAEVEQTAAPVFGTGSHRLGEALATARRRLGDEAFEASRERGRRVPAPEVVELALATIAELTAGDRTRPRRIRTAI